MPYYSGIILNSFYNRLFPELFRHNRRMPTVIASLSLVCVYVCVHVHVCVCVCLSLPTCTSVCMYIKFCCYINLATYIV